LKKKPWGWGQTKGKGEKAKRIERKEYGDPETHPGLRRVFQVGGCGAIPYWGKKYPKVKDKRCKQYRHPLKSKIPWGGSLTGNRPQIPGSEELANQSQKRT